jgi:hypothetical protein
LAVTFGLALAATLGRCAINNEQVPASDTADAGPPKVLLPPPPTPLQQAQELWPHRLDRKALDACIERLSGAGSPEALLLRGRARLFRARAFELHERPPETGSALPDLEAARQDGLDAWRQMAPSVWSADAGVAGAVGAAAVDAVPALVLIAEADDLLGPLRDTVSQLRLLREQAALAGKAVELDPLSQEGAPLRLHAAALTLLPAQVGGDFARARFEFERAISAFPNSLPARVAEASRWAVMAQDLALFRALLGSALKVDAHSPAANRPEQLLARAEAVRLLRRQRHLFLR